MLKKRTWLLCLSAWVLVCGRPAEMPGDSFLRLLDKRHSSVQAPRARWSYRPREDFYRHESRGISHGYPSHPYESTTLKATETSSELPAHSLPWQYWRPGSVDSNSTAAGHHGHHWRTPLGSAATVGGGPSLQDSKQASHSSWYRHPYGHHQMPGHVAAKKTPVHHGKGNAQLQSFDAYLKSKYKKASFHRSATGHRNGAPYLGAHEPAYVAHRYPARKTVHPLHGRYYQSPYQRYAIPSREVSRHRVKAQSEGSAEEASTASPVPTFDGYPTTERMDDAYPEGSSPSDDYSAYGDARHKSDGNYYESYEEAERAASGPEESSYDESTTRGYYGDRIYMSAQVPLVTSDKTAVKNKYFIIRRTSDDDIETIFE